MSDRYLHLMHMTPKQLHNHLTERNLPPLMYKEIYDCVTMQQKRRANNKRRDAQIRLSWDRITGPLTNEIKVIRAMLQYDRENEQRMETLNAYMDVMQRVRSFINMHKYLSQTPRKAQDERVESGKPPYPNDLTHWTDMVPEKVRLSITEAFNALPYRPKAKRKTPFMRDNNEDSGES